MLKLSDGRYRNCRLGKSRVVNKAGNESNKSKSKRNICETAIVNFCGPATVFPIGYICEEKERRKGNTI